MSHISELGVAFGVGGFYPTHFYTNKQKKNKNIGCLKHRCEISGIINQWNAIEMDVLKYPLVTEQFAIENQR